MDELNKLIDHIAGRVAEENQKSLESTIDSIKNLDILRPTIAADIRSYDKSNCLNDNNLEAIVKQVLQKLKSSKKALSNEAEHADIPSSSRRSSLSDSEEEWRDASSNDTEHTTAANGNSLIATGRWSPA